jgi:hypothetical protein
MEKDTVSTSICIVDWNGRYKPSGFPGTFWADYWPNEKVVTFGGDWSDVPDMPSAVEPTEQEIWNWIETHIEGNVD